MSKSSSVVRVHVPARVKSRLVKLSKATARSQSQLALDAIQSYLEVVDWQMQAIEKGIADANAGRLVSHDKVERWLASWGTKDESEPPKWK